MHRYLIVVGSASTTAKSSILYMVDYFKIQDEISETANSVFLEIDSNVNRLIVIVGFERAESFPCSG